MMPILSEMRLSLQRSPPLLPMHESVCNHTDCKAAFQVRGQRLPGEDSHLQDYTTVPSRG